MVRNGFYGCLILVLMLVGCSAHKALVSDGEGWIANEVAKSETLAGHQWGLALYDPAEEKWLYRRNADQYFTPASNTKILTLYTAMTILGERTEGLRYSESGDTLTFWGTGDPSFMYHVKDSNRVLEFLRTYEGHLEYAPLEPVERYGPGWGWDDFKYAYQVERSTLPVFGNRVTFSRLAMELEGTIVPGYFRDYVTEDISQDRFADRLPDANSFSINPEKIDDFPFEASVPFIVSDYDLAQILSQATGRDIELEYRSVFRKPHRSVSGSPTDSLYKRMMQESDNFIAEQLLLLCANEMGQEMSAEHVIEHMQEGVYADAPDAFNWYDGSGLSRYNLFTPRSLVWLLDKIRTERGMEYIESIFPAGGESGTIESWYPGGAKPYIYAKTGTLRNKHSLSGYLIAKSGKVLVFSFMHNNYTGSSSKVKVEMQSLLEQIREKY